ncbi:MAG TPA: MFS transporter [Gemmatimonadales bacterium]|nr:MFS transporter [Gemmatimonadales bacterium]
MGFLEPVQTLDDDATRRAIRAYQADGIASQVRDALGNGTLLVGYALLLGASHTAVGVLAALGPATQVLQLPTVTLVERWRRRKAVCWWAALAGRTAWLAVLAIPVLGPTLRMPALFATVLVTAAFATISAAAWNAWIPDVLPAATRNEIVARRLAGATAVGAVLMLLAGAGVDRLQATVPDPTVAYRVVLAIGALAGLIGLLPLARIPEPPMPVGPVRPWRDVLAAPLQNRTFRSLVAFLAAWTFAVNLSAPFFSVYLLQRVGLSIGFVLALTVLSQLTSAFVMRAWGRVADRFSALTALRVSVIGFLLSVAGWPIAGRLAPAMLVLVALAIIHMLAGLASAGVTLCTTTVAMEIAPPTEVGGYLAANGIVSGIAAALAPISAGLVADWLEPQRLSVTIRWSAPARGIALAPLDLQGLDFLFVATVLLGLYAVHRLLAVPEQRPADRAVVAALADAVREQMALPLRPMTTVPALRDLVHLPLGLLGRLVPERRGRQRPPLDRRSRGGPVPSSAD